MKASVIIPTYHKATYLDLTLAGFVGQTDNHFEVIVVDDGGTDDTRQVVDLYRDILDIKYEWKEKAGRAAARNHALSLATGDIIIFNDDDRLPCPNFIESHKKKIFENPMRVSIGTKHEIISHYSKDIYLVLNEDIRRFIGTNDQFLRAVTNGIEGPQFTRDQVIRDFDALINQWYLSNAADNYWYLQEAFGPDFAGFRFAWVIATTSNLAYRRFQDRDIRFDEYYQGWGVEDNDFAYQLYLNGYSFGFNVEAHNYHQLHPRGENEWTEHYRNLTYFCRKFGHLEPYLFARFCRGDVTLFDVHDIAEQLGNSCRALVDDYFHLLSHKLGFNG